MTVQDQLAELAYMDDAELAQRYVELSGRPAPGHNRRWIVAAITLAVLQNASSRAQSTYDLMNTVDPRNRDPEGMLPGATITRTWRGEKHVVTVLPRGYAWRGQRFLTLPQVARAITGSPMDVRALFGRRDG